MEKQCTCGKNGIGKRLALTGLALLISSFLYSCSDRKVPPPPKHHPELLLEVLERGAKQDYTQMLPRVKKLRALETSSVFLPELEGAVSLNILVREINNCTVKADFARALSLVEQYERYHGPGKETDQVKAQLQKLVELDRSLAALSRPPRNAATFAAELEKMEQLGKKMDFSPKIRNFLEKKRSACVYLKKLEYRRMLFGLWSDTDFLVRTGARDGAQALAAVFASETLPGQEPYQLSLPGVRRETIAVSSAGIDFYP